MIKNFKKYKYINNKIAFGIITIFLCNISCSKAIPQNEKSLSVEQILDGYVVATGGISEYDKLNSINSKMTFIVSATGLIGTITEIYVRPNKYKLQDEYGFATTVTDGNVFWRKTHKNGISLIKGNSLAAAKRDSKFCGLAYWRTTYESESFLGEELIEGKLCYKVALKAYGCKPQICYFDQNTKLLIKVVTEIPSVMDDNSTEMGEISYLEYKKVGNLLLPVRTMSKVSESTYFNYFEYKFNVNVPEETFTIPNEVQKILNKCK